MKWMCFTVAWGQFLLATLCSAAPSNIHAEDLPELVRTQHRSFSIPFHIPQASDADATAQRVVMSVSKDLGITWEPAGEVLPTVGSFRYQTDRDGEYWFRIRVIDVKGRTRGGAGPDVRVLVNAAGPRVVAHVWKGTDGEIICRYAATDDSLHVEGMKFEYRTVADAGWKVLAAVGILSRESPAHLVGEEIWWAGDKTDALAVRITISDKSGNQTIKQFPLEPSDPGLNQDDLARELRVPSLSVNASSQKHTQDSELRNKNVHRGTIQSDGPDWPAEVKEKWTGVTRKDVGIPPAIGGEVKRFISKDPLAESVRSLQGAPVTTVTNNDENDGAGMQYRGRSLRLCTSRHFQWDYEIDQGNETSLKVELWSTRDGGVTWQQSGVDADGVSPIDVSVPSSGLYGFRLEIATTGASADLSPLSGMPPQVWVVVDDEPPEIDVNVSVENSSQHDKAISIEYTCRDQFIAPQTARILFSPNANGPWSTIASGIEPKGVYQWNPDRTAPVRAFICVEVEDIAGNVAKKITDSPIKISGNRLIGHLRDLRESPTNASQDR
ncbi:MAG: hypothetical protein ABGW78_10650 [Pirellulales bacterium]